ncbi:MAG: polyhydroxyalkanoate synthesis repressor PhaR [Alphaproteobacteria bacterium]|nr:polyhydroxyalkanoate synthesis repressor PhaR [Alphaproteobacteria bacterium]
MPASTDKKRSEGQTITIKKYANRRLYNTATSSYVTLDDLARMVKEGIDFSVFDAKSGEDITRSVLTQIIVEEEAKGQNLLPINFLRQLISFYGDSLESVLPRYLEHSMASFARNQEQMRKYLQDTFDGLFPLGNFEEMGKQNMALLEQTMKMFAPFGQGEAGAPPNGARDETEAQARPPATEADDLADLKQKIETLQQQLDKLSER